MDVDFNLSKGACAMITSASMEEIDALQLHPTVQFLSIKKLPQPKPDTPDRYRIIISDGECFVQAMLATTLNDMVDNGTIKKHTVAVLEKHTSNVVQNKRLIIVLGIRILGTATEKLGDPKSLENPTLEAQKNSTETKPNVAVVGGQATKTAMRGGGPPIGAQIFPIEALSPYQNKWTIKARVSQKSDIKHWSNAKGEGKLFNVTFIDDTGEIRATAFNQVVDDLYDRLEEGKVYYISKARVNIAKKKFSRVDSQYELSLERSTDIQECLDTTDVPVVKYNFTELKDLQNLSKDAICDVIAIVKEAHELGEIISKTTQKVIPKRDLTLVDRSGFSVRLTLWGDQAKKYTATEQPVIAARDVKVGDFGGRSLSMYSTSAMTINPDITEAHALRGWFDSAGASANFQSHTASGGTGGGGVGGGINRAEMKTSQEVKDMNLGMDKPGYFSCRVILTHIRTENIMYPACPSDGCNKKVTEVTEGWRCEKCDRTYEGPAYRYLVTVCGADYAGQLWLQGFNDVGQVLFGMAANELKALEERDKDAYDSKVKSVISRIYNVACRAKQDTYNDTTRIRYGIHQMAPLELSQDTACLLDQLSAYT